MNEHVHEISKSLSVEVTVFWGLLRKHCSWWLKTIISIANVKP